MPNHLGYIKLNLKLQIGNDMQKFNKVLARNLFRKIGTTIKSYGLLIEEVNNELHLFENGDLIDKFNSLEEIYKYIINNY